MELPNPTESGSSGEQKEPKHEVTVVLPEPSVGDIFPIRLEGLAASHPDQLGGPVVSQLLAASYTHLHSEFQEQKQKIESLSSLLDSTKEQLFVWKNKAEIRLDKLKSLGRIRSIGNTCITFGLIVFSLGVELLRNKVHPISYIVGAVGLAITLFGWFSGSGGENDSQ